MRIVIAVLLLVASTSPNALAAPAKSSRNAAARGADSGAASVAPAPGKRGLPTTGSGGSCPAVAAPTVKSGQTTSYGPGTDGDLRVGVDPSFRDNGDGTITDERTGLVWEKKSNDGSIHDLDNAYAWGQAVTPYSMNGPILSEFLATLNEEPCFAGHCDWRIPNLRELQTLASYERLNPATWNEFNRDCKEGCTVLQCSCTPGSITWTSTTHRLSPRDAWSIHFANGQSAGSVKTRRSTVRAVRGGR